MSKRPRSDFPTNKTSKRIRKQDSSDRQEIWKILDGVRNQNAGAESSIKNSHLFIPIFSDNSRYSACIEALQEYVDPSKLRLHQRPGVIPAYVVLVNFSLMDCCLVLPLLFDVKNRSRVSPFPSIDHFTIPRETNLCGSFYLPSSCTRHEANNTLIHETRFQTNYNFKEYYARPQTTLRQFIRNLTAFFSGIKFGKSTKITSKQFYRALTKPYNTIDLGIKEIPFMGEGLYDVAQLVKSNLPLIEKAKTNMQHYAQDLIQYNCAPLVKETALSAPKQPPKPQQSPKVQQQSSSKVNSSGATSRPNYMTQDQIKQHCIATVRASQDVVKGKSPYQILKTYVKCPRQSYIDQIYQNLNDLRSRTNCNIVVLNLNNLHESRSWFDSLEVSKFTPHAQQPHPSTVRVVSIGGIGEHVIKALDLIYNILQQ